MLLGGGAVSSELAPALSEQLGAIDEHQDDAMEGVVIGTPEHIEDSDSSESFHPSAASPLQTAKAVATPRGRRTSDISVTDMDLNENEDISPVRPTPNRRMGGNPRACSPIVAGALAPLTENHDWDQRSLSPNPVWQYGAGLHSPSTSRKTSPIVAAALSPIRPGRADRRAASPPPRSVASFAAESSPTNSPGTTSKGVYEGHWKHALEDMVSNPRKYSDVSYLWRLVEWLTATGNCHGGQTHNGD